MKVILATMQFGRGYYQGTERYVQLLADGLARRGHDICIFAGDPQRRRPDLPPGEIVQQDPLVLAYPRLHGLALRGPSVEQLVTLLGKLSPDLLHIANCAHLGTNLIAAGRRLGVPVIVTVMDYWWLCPKHTLWHTDGRACTGDVDWRDCMWCLAANSSRYPVRRLGRTRLLQRGIVAPLGLVSAVRNGLPLREAWAWRHRRRMLLDALNEADHVVFPSEAARAALSPFLHRPHLHTIAYGLEDRWFAKPPGPPKAHPIATESLVIGFAGSLQRHKGAHLLLEAIRKLDWIRTRILLAGDGPDQAYQEHLRKLAEGIDVVFLGPVPTERMPQVMGGLDVLVVPSCWPENLPIVALEAQALGVPVLGSRVAGIAEAIDRPELLFDSNRADSLAACLDMWRRRGGRSAVRVSTADEMVDQTLAIHAAARRTTVPDV